MTITIIGTGNMAKGIAVSALRGGHRVELHARELPKATALAGELQKLAPGKPAVTAVPSGSAVAGEMVVLAVPYAAAAAVMKEYGDKLAGKIIIDITNPLDWNTMDPVTPPASSAAEEIAKLAPAGAKVVKAFNTTFAGTLVAGNVAGQPLDVFIAGDDEAARKAVARLVTDAGLRPIDAGPLKRARQLEATAVVLITTHQHVAPPFTAALKIIS